MKYTRLLVAKMILFAITPGMAEVAVPKPLPNTPSASMIETYGPDERMVVHNTPSYAPEVRNPIRDWKFWAGTGVAFGAMAYDWHQTVSYQGTACVEGNIDGQPLHPSVGALAKKDLPMQFGLLGMKYVLAKYARVPWWSYSTTDGIAAAIHIRSGLMWNGCR